MGKLKENWQLAVFITILSVIMSTVGAVIVQRSGIKDVKIDNAAPIEYVDKKNSDLKGYVDTQDNALRIELHEAKSDIREDMKRIDQKLDNITDILMRNK